MRIGGGAVSIADVTNRTARDLGFVRPFWLNEIRNDRAFHRGGALAASAGNFNEIQLFNPAGSGITVVIKRILASVAAASGVMVRRHDPALATLDGTGFNLRAGGAAAQAVIRTTQIAALDGTRISEQLLGASVITPIAEDWNKELPANTGLLVTGRGVNIELMVYYEWNEV